MKISQEQAERVLKLADATWRKARQAIEARTMEQKGEDMPNTEFNLKCFVVDREQQRYPTLGDWEDYMGNITIRVSRMTDPRYQQLIALHEVVECLLCRWSNVPQEEVDEWDRRFEEARKTPPYTPYDEFSEPGDVPEAPYHRQHVIASAIERLAASLLGVDWNLYEQMIYELP